MHERHEFDVLIVGAGPAGLAAAGVIADAKLRVGLIDDNPDLGGQIWRADVKQGPDWMVKSFLNQEWGQRVIQLCSTRVVARLSENELLAEAPTGAARLRFEKLILATGARERFLPFPGWTLPGVMGAGGLQALAKGGWPVAGKRIVVAGSGPLLLAVAAYLKKSDAQVLCVAEQAASSVVQRFVRNLFFAHFGKLLQGLALRARLARVPYRTGCWPRAAYGDGKLRGVQLVDERCRTFDVPCDYLACGFGLIPNIELAMLLGCAVLDGCVTVDARQETSMPGIFAAGEVTGIGGLEKSLAEGAIAGFAAAEIAATPELAREIAARSAAEKFAGLLEKTFALREEVLNLATAETMVCRCEDVSAGELGIYSGTRAAKLQTRCGMGPCQGRICGNQAPRPPLFPVQLQSLVTTEGDDR